MNIIILSRNAALYSTQSLVEAARRRNHYVRVIDHMMCDLVIESGKSKILFNNQQIQNIDAVIPRIGSTATTYGAAVIRQFESQGVFSTLHAEPLLKARDKLSCLQILGSHGIGVPKTIYVSNQYTMPFLLEEMEPYPIIIKLVSGTQGMGVILAENKSNAESILEAFYATREKVIMQKFIREAKGADIRAFVVDGEIVGAMKRQAKPGDFRSNLHRGGTSELITLTSQEEETALKSVEILGLKIAGVDMLKTNSGPVVLEVNASPGLEGIEGTTGVDIAGKIISFIEKNRK
ncbi:MAG: RimK family alpha-L-glutamate ligase [Saprospiraceae bacterium]|jgi:ribosomal protein S6--L-glutamate ligase|nr:RimK family alpha-L-glutamate ligase [Saprospiraceae bacterium]MBK6666557.1 RimK family alpha-L-glutamate ligase [Saprospiraceae bacterium]MBK7700513.1 RimK family alpha-L-glutamate ligase [Saprospiraceae bacterium]MBK8828364.1 RimK family alpha-L-glutamate ligase [Saprospiraceae bacterium]MBK8887096.1 RimK family alpha-L-glutamate ligase [Saprospiraceae bacterium]